MKINRETLKIGLEKPIRLLLTGDNHLSYADARESEVKRAHAKQRNVEVFSCGMGEENLRNRFCEIAEYAKSDCDLLVMAGDVIDHPSACNLEIFRDTVRDVPYVYTVGNHDYNNFAVERESIPLLESRTEVFREALGREPFNTSRQIGGLNIVSLQDTLCQFDGKALSFLESEIRRGLPVLLLLHVPLYAETLCESVIRYWRFPILTGVPAEVFRDRGLEVRPIAPETQSVLERVEKEPLVRGVLAGHIHFASRDVLPCGKPQVVCEAGYLGSATEITVE